MRNFGLEKWEDSKSMNMSHRLGENTCKRHLIKDLYPQYTKIPLQLNDKRTNNSIKRWVKDLKRHLTKKTYMGGK